AQVEPQAERRRPALDDGERCLRGDEKAQEPLEGLLARTEEASPLLDIRLDDRGHDRAVGTRPPGYRSSWWARRSCACADGDRGCVVATTETPRMSSAGAGRGIWKQSPHVAPPGAGSPGGAQITTGPGARSGSGAEA